MMGWRAWWIWGREWGELGRDCVCGSPGVGACREGRRVREQEREGKEKGGRLLRCKSSNGKREVYKSIRYCSLRPQVRERGK